MVVEPTTEQQSAMRTYGGVMQEIRARLELVDRLIAGDHGVNSHYTKEFCYLQLRMICELIAIGCLVAHGDIKDAERKRVRKQTSPAILMTMLNEAHADFYPIPMEMWRVSTTHWEQREIRSEYLTKDDLKALYGECGDPLHRTSLKKYVANEVVRRCEFPAITRHVEKIRRLLDVHRMMMSDRSGFVFCRLVDAEQPERVFVMWAGRTITPTD